MYTFIELALKYFREEVENGKNIVTVLDKAWAGKDYFFAPKVPVLNKNILIRGYSLDPHSQKSRQERFLIGYRGESDISLYQRYDRFCFVDIRAHVYC